MGYCSSNRPRLLAFGFLLAVLPGARAAGIVFATGPQLLNGLAENASAEFQINSSTHSITIRLLNLVINPGNVDQAIGSLRFTLTGAGFAVPNDLVPGISDTRLDISNSGTPIKVAVETSTLWQTSASLVSTGWQIQLCAVCASGGTYGLIIGGPNSTSASAKYTVADATLKDGRIAQWIIGSGLTYSGGTLRGHDTSPDFTIQFEPTVSLANVRISNVIFGFGADPNYGWDFLEVGVETPEPDSVILYATGIGLLVVASAIGGLRRRESAERRRDR